MLSRRVPRTPPDVCGSGYAADSSSHRARSAGTRRLSRGSWKSARSTYSTFSPLLHGDSFFGFDFACRAARGVKHIPLLCGCDPPDGFRRDHIASEPKNIPDEDSSGFEGRFDFHFPDLLHHIGDARDGDRLRQPDAAERKLPVCHEDAAGQGPPGRYRRLRRRDGSQRCSPLRSPQALTS